MKKLLLPFALAFSLGAIATLALRAARHTPYAADPQAGHAIPAESKSETVNTVCPICGMDVDPSLATVEYQGKRIGLGCRACPPKFAANPDTYGPAALKNEVVD